MVQINMRSLRSFLIAAALCLPWLTACDFSPGSSAPAVPNAGAQDVLRPERAYPYEVTADGDRVKVRFDIVDGYYLYRNKFGFRSETARASLGAAAFPAGEIHSDEFFGEQEIYRGAFEIEVPYTRTGAVDALELAMDLQGCADIGLCYPPQTWMSRVDLPAPAAAPRAARGLPLFAPAADELLPVDQAFVMNARFDGPNLLTVSWQIEPGYYLYRDQLAVEASGDIDLGAAEWPQGVPHYDDNFGDVQVFYGHVEGTVPFARASPNELPVEIRG